MASEWTSASLPSAQYSRYTNGAFGKTPLYASLSGLTAIQTPHVTPVDRAGSTPKNLGQCPGGSNGSITLKSGISRVDPADIVANT